MAAACNPPQWLFPLLHMLEGQWRCPIHQPHRMVNMMNTNVNLGRMMVKVTSMRPIYIHRIRPALNLLRLLLHKKHYGWLCKAWWFCYKLSVYSLLLLCVLCNCKIYSLITHVISLHMFLYFICILYLLNIKFIIVQFYEHISVCYCLVKMNDY